MIKSVLLTIFLLISFINYSQNKRFVKMTGSTDNHQPFICTKPWIHFSHQTMVDEYNVFLDYIYRDTGEDEAFAVREVGDGIGFRIYCDRHGTGHFSEKIYVPQTGNTITVPQYYEENGCSSAWGDGTAFFYDAYNILNIKDLINGGIYTNQGINICVSNASNPVISVSVENVVNKFPNSSCYLVAERQDGSRISLTYLSSASNNSISFSSIANGQDIYGLPVRFRILTRFNTPYSGSFDIETAKSIGPFRFFREMTGVTNFKLKRTACSKDTLFITVPQSIITNTNNFRFRARKSISAENSSNIISLKTGAPIGNVLPLYADQGQGADFDLTGGEYVMQIFGNEFKWDEYTINLECATTLNFTLPAKPETLNTQHSLTSYTFNNFTYNLTRYGATDGQVSLTLTAGTADRINRFEYSFNGGTWQQIPANLLGTIGTTTNFTGLQAGYYQLKVIDMDGCESNPISFNLIQPNQLSIGQVNRDPVSCHANNTGPHSDGQIGASLAGGIGPYQVSVFNSSNNLVYSYTDPTAISFQTPGNLPAGQYRIRLTDRFGSVTETTATLGSNPELKLSTIAKPYTCSGTADGSIVLKTQNKVTAYADYNLSGQSAIHTTSDTAVFSQLVTGNYTATVTNSNGCSATISNISITGPEPITISGITSNPVCHNTTDGSITTSVTGGNSEYSYLWSNGIITPNLGNLNRGQYTLTVKDSKGCTSENSFIITPPPAPTEGWHGKSITLCTGNELYINTSGNNQVEWRREGELLSVNNSFTVYQQGTYTLKIRDKLGCVGRDTFQVKVSDHPLNAVLLVQDSALVNEKIEAIDVTWPVPDSITWLFDKPVLTGNSNEWSQQFSYETTGVVNVTLRAWCGGCFSDSTKTVTIYYKEGEISMKQMEEMPLILGFKAFPNPSNGNFKAQVKLSRLADIMLKVYSLQNPNLILSKEYEGLEEYEIQFNLNELSVGVYVILINAEKEQQSIRIIIE